MNTQPLDTIPLPLLILAIGVLMLLALQLGFKVGKRRAGSDLGELKSQVSGAVGAMIGIIGFFLAFTYGMAGSWFEARREVVIREANAIGTAYLRAGLLPKPWGPRSQELLAEYTDTRLSAPAGAAVADVRALISKSERLHQEMWQQLTDLVANTPSTPVTGSYIQALNEVIDTHTIRVGKVLHNRIPVVLWLLLYTVCFLGIAMMGYQSGLSGVRNPVAPIVVITFTLVLGVITDLDRVGEGFFSASQWAMRDLQRSVHSSAAAPAPAPISQP